MAKHTIKTLSLLSALSTSLTALANNVDTPLAEGNKEKDTETIVVTGVKSQSSFGEKSGIPLEKMPQSVQVISADEIIASGATSIGDVLRSVPSADPGYSRVGAWQSFSLKVRGFIADQMRNGMRQRYYEDVDASALSNIDRIEVLKGPSGVLYGQSGVGGIISIVTKRPEKQFAANGALSLGSFDQKQLSVDITDGVSDTIALRFVGEIERSDSFVDHQPMNRNNFAFSADYTPSDWVTFHLVSEYVDRETKRYAGLPVLGTVLSNGVETLDISTDLGEPDFANLTAHAPLIQLWADIGLSDNWVLTPRLQYQEFNTRFGEIRVRDPLPNETTVFARTGRIGHEDDEYNIAQLDLTGVFDTGAVHHRVLFGYEFNKERGQFTQSNLTNVQAINALNPDYMYDDTAAQSTFAYNSFYNVDSDAIYAQDMIALTQQWDVIAAARYSQIDAADGDFGGSATNHTRVYSTIWQLGTTYKWNEHWSGFAGINTGFDIESTAGVRTRTGKPLQPEQSRQTELGIRYNTDNAQSSASVFEIERIDAVTSDPADPDYSINAGEQRVRGIELQTELAPTDDWKLGFGYAYLDNIITESNDGDEGKRIGDVPHHTLHVNVLYNFNDQWGLRTEISYTSDRALTNGSAIFLPAYTIGNLSVNYRHDAINVSLYIDNVFDETYYNASGNRFVVIPGEPRSAGIRFSKTF